VIGSRCSSSSPHSCFTSSAPALSGADSRVCCLDSSVLAATRSRLSRAIRPSVINTSNLPTMDVTVSCILKKRTACSHMTRHSVNAGLRLTPLRRNRIDPPQVVVVSVTIDWDRSVVSLCLASLPVWVQVEGQRLQPAFSLVDDSFLLGCSVCDCGATADPELL
jgi:hypothetical protein